MNIIRYFFLLIALISSTISLAQISIDGLDLDGNIDGWFQSVLDDVPPPYLIGAQYLITGQSREQNEFYKNIYWAEGDLIFGGRDFHNVKMLYNTFQDELIFFNLGMKTESVQSILPNQNQIDEFTIYDTRFINLKNSSTPPTGNGFYELYYEGINIVVLIKHSKMKETSGTGSYKMKRDIFLSINDNYFELTNKRSIYALFPSKKDQIKRFIKTSGVKFNRQNSKGLKELMKFCDENYK